MPALSLVEGPNQSIKTQRKDYPQFPTTGQEPINLAFLSHSSLLVRPSIQTNL